MTYDPSATPVASRKRGARSNLTLDDLPMFANDLQIAEAIVGRERAAEWVKTRLPTLATRPGFPKIDAFHGGRPVKLIAIFYETYLGLRAGQAGVPDGKEGEWRGRRSI